MAKMRLAESGPTLPTLLPREGTTAARRVVITLGELVSAAYRVAGTTAGTARLLRDSSPLGQLLDRRIVIG